MRLSGNNVSTSGNITAHGNITTYGDIFTNQIKSNNTNNIAIYSQNNYQNGAYIKLNGSSATHKPGSISTVIGVNGVFEVFKYENDNGTDKWHSRLKVTSAGNVIIQKSLQIKEEIFVDANYPLPDYVFDEDYNLMPIPQLETYIIDNHHLPNVPSASEVEQDGLKLVKMNIVLLEKVEELTLYIIELNKRIEQLENQK